MSHGDLVRIVEPSERRNATPEELPGQGEPSEELKAVRAQFGNRVQCKYYGTCSGCQVSWSVLVLLCAPSYLLKSHFANQYQPLSYDDQLEIKRNVVRKAFANFSRLDASLIPAIGPTLPSPLQYGYRTKLTPHFQAPPSHGKSGGRRNQWKGKGKGVEPPAVAEEDEKPWEVTIGFEQKGRKRIIDIEECVIATKVINDAMVHEREKVKT